MPELKSVVPPDSLLFLAHAVENADNAASTARRVHAHLAAALGRCLCASSEYHADVCHVVGAAAAAAAAVPSPPQALPSLAHGVMAPPEPTLAQHGRMLGAKATPLSDDTRSYMVHLIRRDVLSATVPRVSDGAAAPAAPDHRRRLAALLARYGAECQFKRTADRYLHLCVRALLPPWAACPLSPEDTPFPLAARMLGDQANDTLRPLIEMDVARMMAALQEAPPGCPDAHDATAFLVAAVLVEELCGGRHVFLNDDVALMGPAAVAGPLLGVLTSVMDASSPVAEANDQWGAVIDGTLHPGNDVYDALLLWLQAVAPVAGEAGNGLADLWAAVRDGHGSLTGGNTVAKYLPPDVDTPPFALDHTPTP